MSDGHARKAEPRMKSLPTVVDCEGCGACCMHMGYPVFVLGTDKQPAEEIWLTLPDDLRQELDHFVASYPTLPAGQLDGPCFWFDPVTKRCKHHDHRPRVCRDFSVGSKGCLEWREWLRERSE